MDLRSYLRGLGVGMALTTVVLVISFGFRDKQPTNSEIVSMAKELGMIETSAFFHGEETTGSVPFDKESSTGQSQVAESEGNNESTQNTDTADGSNNSGNLENQENSSQNQSEAPSDEVIVVVLKNTYQAYMASEALEQAGVIENAEEFSEYLVKNLFSRIIQDGEYTFTKGMSYEEIANIITHENKKRKKTADIAENADVSDDLDATENTDVSDDLDITENAGDSKDLDTTEN